MYNTKVIDLFKNFDEGIAEGVKLIKAGDVVAFPTETVYGLGADCFRSEAVKMIFAAKSRPADNPLIVHVHSMEQVLEIAMITPEAEELMRAFWPGPLTLVLNKRKNIPTVVTAGLPSVAVRMPDDEAALELIEKAGVPLAAPSANLSGSPSPTSARHVLDDLGGRIPLILDGGFCEVGVESTVVKLDGSPQILRPGAITPEMLEEIIGKVTINEGVLNSIEQAAMAPGMKYRHYSPKAELVLVADSAGQAAKISEIYDQKKAMGKDVMIFATKQSELFYTAKKCVIMGERNDAATVCSNLYSMLRDADSKGVECIIIEALPAEGMGLAYMNRVLRACGFAMIN